MNINLANLNETQLRELNQQVVERLRHLQQMKTMRAMENFAPGERVCFDTSSGETVTGTIVKFNKKSVTVITDDRHRWNVAPGFLRKVIQTQVAKAQRVITPSREGDDLDEPSKNAPCPCGSGKKFKRCCLAN